MCSGSYVQQKHTQPAESIHRQQFVLCPAGQFEERVFIGLDFVLAEAGRRGLKVLLALTNYWTPFGGMTQYVK